MLTPSLWNLPDDYRVGRLLQGRSGRDVRDHLGQRT